MNILISIGNSDDKLTQREWSEMVTDMRDILDWPGVQLHGEWFSRPDSPWQNANWCVEVTTAASRSMRALRPGLRRLDRRTRRVHHAGRSGRMTEIHLHGITPVVLNPGDKVLLAVADTDRMSPNQFADFVNGAAAQLKERFPNVEFTFLSGVESVTVQRAEGEQQ